MAQFIHLGTMADMFRSRADIVAETNKRIAEGRESYRLVQAENARALSDAETTVEKAEVKARIAQSEAVFLREEATAREYISVASRNENGSGFELFWRGVWS